MSSEPINATFLNPDSLPRPAGYSHVVIVPANARIVHVSGQVSMDRDGRIIGDGDFAAQATQVFENLRAALQAAGAGFGNVVKINMFVLDMAHLLVLRDVRDRFINRAAPPASTLVQVSRFFRDGLLFEMDATAVLPA